MLTPTLFNANSFDLIVKCYHFFVYISCLYVHITFIMPKRETVAKDCINHQTVVFIICASTVCAHAFSYMLIVYVFTVYHSS